MASKRKRKPLEEAYEAEKKQKKKKSLDEGLFIAKKSKRQEENQAFVSWKTALKKELVDFSAFSPEDLHQRIGPLYELRKTVFLIQSYVGAMLNKIVKWDTEAVLNLTKILQTLPERVSISEREFWTFLNQVLTVIVGSGQNMMNHTTDCLLIHAIMGAFSVRGYDEDDLAKWRDVFINILRRTGHHRVRTLLEHAFKMWKASTQPCKHVNRNFYEQTSQVWHMKEMPHKWCYPSEEFFCNTSIAFLEWWLQGMEMYTSRAFPLLLPEFHQCIQMAMRLDPVRCRFLSRAFAVSSHPLHICFPPQYRNVPVYTPTINQILLETPVVYYVEGGNQVPLEPEIFQQMHDFRKNFLIRRPKTMGVTDFSHVWPQLYENKPLWQECLQIWDAELQSHLLPELSGIVQQYMHGPPRTSRDPDKFTIHQRT